MRGKVGWNKRVLVQITTSLKRVRLGLPDCVADGVKNASRRSCRMKLGLEPPELPCLISRTLQDSSHKPGPAMRLPAGFLSRCWDTEGGRCPGKLSLLTQSLVTAHTRIWSSAAGKLSRPGGAPTSHEAKADTETEDKRRVGKQRTSNRESPRCMCLI